MLFRILHLNLIRLNQPRKSFSRNPHLLGLQLTILWLATHHKSLDRKSQLVGFELATPSLAL